MSTDIDPQIERAAIEAFCLAIEERRAMPESVTVAGWEFRPAFCLAHQKVTRRRASLRNRLRERAWVIRHRRDLDALPF